jgi:hypothetical protein
MKNKVFYIKALAVIFTLVVALILSVYIINKLPFIYSLIIGGALGIMHIFVIPIIRGIKGKIPTISKEQKARLYSAGFPKQEYHNEHKITYAEAFYWLRTEKDIYIYPARYEDEDGGFMWEIWEEKGPEWHMKHFGGYCKSWNDMEVESLTEALDFLEELKEK